MLFLDYACSAPYEELDGRYSDAIFFSVHKFLGGMSTPGILIANKELFANQSPFIPGGGCVRKVSSQYIEYENDVEKRETAGTPNIVGIIKIKKVMELKNIFLSLANKKEYAITSYVYDSIDKLMKKYPDLIVILPKTRLNDRLPIVCISIKNLHYNLIVALLSDLFGIQTRGGVSCTGLLAELIENNYGIKGWCRITFNWLMDKEEIDYILRALEHIIVNHSKYRDKYKYDNKENLFTFVSS